MSEEKRSRILIADDEDSIRYVLRQALEAAGHQVEEVADGSRALEELTSGDYDLAFLDIRMPGHSGLELLDLMSSAGCETAAVIITAQATMNNAIESMKRGALDYLTKPFSIAEATALAEKALRTRSLQLEVEELRKEVSLKGGRGHSGRMVGRSSALLDVFKTVGKVAGSNVSVLITGESGTGKELVARAIHNASPRSQAEFVAVNAAAIPRELLESELFGHERGAFTGAVDSRPGRFREASGGTLFLDEIGDMPLALQAKLLRVLQSGEIISVGGRAPEHVDVRILAATHRNLEEEVLAGRFREDLLYRLRVVPIHLPALRDRVEDTAVLAKHFVERYSAELCDEVMVLTDDALSTLTDYPWPGNVRELENAIKRAVVLASRSVLTPDDFDFLARETETGSEGRDLGALVRKQALEVLADPNAEEVYHAIVRRIERPLLEAALDHTDGNQLRAARLLGINRNTLRKKILDLKIDMPKRDGP